MAQTAALKVPEWPSYGNSRKVTQNPHFLKKCKGGTKANFSKIAQEDALAEKAQKHCGETVIILYFVSTYTAKTGQDFGAQGGSKSASEKVQTGDQGKFFKNRSKSKPRLKSR